MLGAPPILMSALNSSLFWPMELLICPIEAISLGVISVWPERLAFPSRFSSFHSFWCAPAVLGFVYAKVSTIPGSSHFDMLCLNHPASNLYYAMTCFCRWVRKQLWLPSFLPTCYNEHWEWSDSWTLQIFCLMRQRNSLVMNDQADRIDCLLLRNQSPSSV